MIDTSILGSMPEFNACKLEAIMRRLGVLGSVAPR